MSRSKRMRPVAEVTERRQQDAARRMGERQRDLDAQVRRLDELIAYREEYALRFESGTAVQGMAGMAVREFRLFLTRLGHAIEEQKRHVEQAREALEQSRGDWSECRIRTDAVNNAIDRMKAEERVVDARREQAETDEFGLRMRFIER